MITITRRLYSQGSKLARTPLYKAHVELGGKMVPYAGYEMPVLYKNQSHIDSHNWVRSKVGLFDVSHMLQHNFSGKDSVDLLQKITPSDLRNMEVNSSTLSMLLNEKGGVVDDCIITKHADYQFYVVTNAGRRAEDLHFIKTEADTYGDLHHLTFESTLLAIQGPKAAKLLQKYTSQNLSEITFGRTVFTKLAPVTSQVHLARSGYTGEDGFELSIPSSTNSEIEESLDFFLSLISDHPELVRPIGLAARDSLRLEAGMCLYGHELNEETTPVEASLTWTIPKSRRGEDSHFNGLSKILGQIRDKASFKHRRIGVISKGPSPRDGNTIVDTEGNEIGYVTSGSPSPTLGGNIAQAYINKKYKIGSPVKIQIRGKQRDGIIVKLPFVTSNFYRG